MSLWTVFGIDHTDCYKAPRTETELLGTFTSYESACRCAIMETCEQVGVDPDNRILIEFLAAAKQLDTWAKIYAIFPGKALWGESTFTDAPNGYWCEVKQAKNPEDEIVVSPKNDNQWGIWCSQCNT